MKKIFYFNNQELKRNKHLINYSNLSECPNKKYHYFIKHFSRIEIPNNNKLSLIQNNFISTEESTIIKTEDFSRLNKNYCKCICHEIYKKIIIHKINRNSNNNCNCPCHLCDKSMISYSNILNKVYQIKPKINYIQRVCRSVDNFDNINNSDFNLIDEYRVYDDLNKKYIDIKKQLYNFDTYNKKLKHSLSILSGGKYNESEKEKYIFRNFSNSDLTIKYNNYLYNKSSNNFLEKSKNISKSPSFSNEYNRNRASNLNSHNLSYSFYNEKRNNFSPLFENYKNKRYLSNNNNYIINNKDYYLYKNKNPFNNNKNFCIRNTMSYNKEIGEKNLTRRESKEKVNKNYYIKKNDSLNFKNRKNFYKFSTFSNNFLIESFGNRYSHYSLEETIHSSVNKNSYLPHPKSFGKDEIDRNIYFPQNSEKNIIKNKQKRIEKNNIKRRKNDIIFEKNPFKTESNKYYCIQKVINIFLGKDKEKKNNDLCSSKNNEKVKIIYEIHFNLINDKKNKISNNKNYLNNENIKFNNKNIINANIVDKVDNFNIIKDNNLQKKSKLKAYNKVYDNIMKDNIMSFNILKDLNNENKLDKKKYNDNKKENVNNINIFPLKKNNIQSKKKSEKDTSTKIEEKRIDNINKIIEKILLKNNKKEDKVNRHKNNSKITKKGKDLNKNKIFLKDEQLYDNPSIDNLLNYSISNINQIKKNEYPFNKNDGDDIKNNKKIYQSKFITKNNKTKKEFQNNLTYQNQNKNNINLLNKNNYNNSKDKILLPNHKINSKILSNKKKDNLTSFNVPKKNHIYNELNNRDKINENSIIFKLINENNNPFNSKINNNINGNNEMNNLNKQKGNYDMNKKSQKLLRINTKKFQTIKELNQYYQNKNSKNIKSNEYKIESKIKIEENSNHLFKKVYKRSKTYANLIDKKYNKNKQKMNNLGNFKRNNIPYLGFLNMNEIKKLNQLNNSKNNIFYNNIINPFKNTKKFNNSSSNKLIFKEIETYDNIKVINSKKDNIISDRKNIFDLSFSDKKKYMKYNNSCFFQNYLKLGGIKYITRYRSVYKSLCFACNLGCSVSKSGYSQDTVERR